MQKYFIDMYNELAERQIKGEKAKLIKDRIREISSLSGVDALNAFNSLYREVLEG